MPEQRKTRDSDDDDNNNNNNNNSKYNINENDNNVATNDKDKINYDNTNKKIANNKNKSNFKNNTKKKNFKKSAYIVGDSIVKEVKGFELSKSIKHKYSVRVRFHPSTKTSCINDHVKLAIRNQEADHIILHTGTNELSSDETPVQICNDTVNLAASIKGKDIKVTISKILE